VRSENEESVQRKASSRRMTGSVAANRFARQELCLLRAGALLLYARAEVSETSDRQPETVALIDKRKLAAVLEQPSQERSAGVSV
jgi:hypothetical protein